MPFELAPMMLFLVPVAIEAGRGDRESGDGELVVSDLHSKARGIAFQLARLAIEGLRHQVPTAHEEQMSCGVGAG